MLQMWVFVTEYKNTKKENNKKFDATNWNICDMTCGCTTDPKDN